MSKIAFEKAGIIKSNIPVVIGEYEEETQSVFLDKAKIEDAPIYFAQDNPEVTYECVIRRLSEKEFKDGFASY